MDFTSHQLVQEGFEQVVEDGAFFAVQVGFAVYGIEDGDDFALFVHVGNGNNLGFDEAVCHCRITGTCFNFCKLLNELVSLDEIVNKLVKGFVLVAP